LSAVERDTQEETREALLDVRQDDDVLRVRRIHGDRLLRLVPHALAQVDVGRNRASAGGDRDERERDEDWQDADKRPFHHHSPPLEWSRRGYTRGSTAANGARARCASRARPSPERGVRAAP